MLNFEVESSSLDIKEPAADLQTVLRYKASQFERVLVEDVSLEVEGHDIGIHVRWNLAELQKAIGSQATFHCWIAIREGEDILIYKGSVHGVIVLARGVGFGFDPQFQPLGSDKTFAESKPDQLNPRYIAVQKFLNSKPDEKCTCLFTWNGSFQ